MWHKTHIIALLKPGKSPTDAKNFRPIALLCYTYKLLEIMILNRVMPTTDKKLISEQAGFRPGKN
jgi:hypothetical protein